MKIDPDIIESAIKEGMPPKPMPEDFKYEDDFEEAFGYWMSHYGRILVLRQKIRDLGEK